MPDRKKIVNGRIVEEYWWGGKFVVYIDNHATEETFDVAVERLKREERNAGGAT